VVSAKHTKKGILRTRALWMSGLSSSHLEGVQQSSKYCALRIPTVQESFSTRVVNIGGKQDLIRSPQEDKCLVATENDRWRWHWDSITIYIHVKILFFFFFAKRRSFHLVEIHLIIHIWTRHSWHLNIHDKKIC
jgi:hypothetical protein